MKYTTIAVLTLQAGYVLGLSDAQAAVRKSVLTPVPAERKGWYRTTAQVQFKVGEEFLYEGDLPKSLATAVETVDKQSAKAKAKAQARELAQADAEAKAKSASDAAAAQAKAAEEAAALLAFQVPPQA